MTSVDFRRHIKIRCITIVNIGIVILNILLNIYYYRRRRLFFSYISGWLLR